MKSISRSILFLFFIALAIFAVNQSEEDSIVNQYDLSSTALPYGALDSVKQKFTQYVQTHDAGKKVLSFQNLSNYVSDYNQAVSKAGLKDYDAIDYFISLLPESYRRHFTLVHRSYSVQESSPLSPRVIMYGQDAQVMMTFNAGEDVNHKPMRGGDSIEVIAWNPEKKIWEFSELEFGQNKMLTQHKNPTSCVMCHAGTPKPVDVSQAAKYQNVLKPIFPQYPFWPGFYGSVNDIIGIDESNSKDTIMRSFKATMEQIKGLTFAGTEELFQLNQALNQNPRYQAVVQNEFDVHQKYFKTFMDSMKSRNRYRHLLTVKDMYLSEGKSVPEVLKSAPYRRTFDKDYGHYLLRPNFYLSSLMTFYQAQFIAEQIKKTSFYNQIKFSFLARKYNCSIPKNPELAISELDPSFDLIYPNVSSQESRNKQYLLSYQYNVVKNPEKSLPLHSWNLELNENIASYHYGNVFADMNEVVLWQLVNDAFPNIDLKSGRSAAEERHFKLSNSDYFEQKLFAAKGFVARMTTAQQTFATSQQPYYGLSSTFKTQAQPVSSLCDSVLVPAARNEMISLVQAKKSKQLPHDIYVLDQRLYENEILADQPKMGINLVRQACEGCHNDQIKPVLNVNWFSDNYHMDLHAQKYFKFKTGIPESSAANPAADTEVKSAFEYVLAKDRMQVPFDSSMPFGRRAFDSLSLQCETLIINNRYNNPKKMSFSEIFNCSKNDPQLDPNSLGCRCKKLNALKEELYKAFYEN
jgi:hypothetical protein